MTHPLENLGILGGGQLGCMLMDAAISMGLSPRLYAEPGSPGASEFSSHHPAPLVGTLDDEALLRRFFTEGATTIIFENEFLDVARLKRASEGLAVTFLPSLDALEELQDKLRQKEILSKLGIPTSPFFKLAEESGDPSEVHSAFERFQGQIVFKWARLGYDGKGVLLAKESPAGRQEAVEFCRRAQSRGIPIYAERRVNFRRELAIVAVRSTRGEFDAYPLVISEQNQGICKRVLGPASAFGVPTHFEVQAREAARHLAESLGLVGTFALEMFETASGELLVNEIAPRVHNTGHFTQDACETSQFQNHWRAILGQPLGFPQPRDQVFGMLNLLGPDGLELTLAARRDPPPFELPPPPWRLHWYGKSKICRGRKLGHLNGIWPARTPETSIRAAMDQSERLWQSSLHPPQSPSSTDEKESHS